MNQHEEIDSLKKELEDFRREKDRVRSIIGSIGGKQGKKKELVINIIFSAVVLFVFTLASMKYLFNMDIPLSSPFLSEIGLLLISVKIILLMNQQMRIGHFQFWILNSIEFRLNDISKQIKSLEQRDSSVQDSGE